MQITRHIAGLTVLAVCVAAGAISASDRTAVYARIDKVVLEPTAESPQRAQVWGVFAMAKPNDMNDYLPPARGYLYFALATNPQAAQKEWADLQSVAGTNQVVGFGSRWELKARVRNADEKPEKAESSGSTYQLVRMLPFTAPSRSAALPSVTVQGKWPFPVLGVPSLCST